MHRNRIYKCSYNSSNIQMYYLSPYCRYQQSSNGMYIWREDMGTYIVIPCEEERSLPFLRKLEKGFVEAELKTHFLKVTSCDSEEEVLDWIAACVKGGIIE